MALRKIEPRITQGSELLSADGTPIIISRDTLVGRLGLANCRAEPDEAAQKPVSDRAEHAARSRYWAGAATQEIAAHCFLSWTRLR